MINLKEQKLGEVTRKSFSRTRFNLELPNLVEIQTRSYRWFLEEGLTEVLHEVSPITDFRETCSLSSSPIPSATSPTTRWRSARSGMSTMPPH